MIKIYSKIEPNKLLHFVVRLKDIKEGREDLVSPDNFIQCSSLKLKKGTTFKPHKHFWKYREEQYIAQESWIVISGKVKCIFYDLDNKILKEIILKAGDSSFTLEGGHNYLLLDDSVIMEYKTGKYEGQQRDKVFIQQVI